MVNNIGKNLLRFVLLVLVQVLIVKNIDLGGLINPFLYVLFILMLPFETPAWLLLLLSFFLGLSIDMFYDTMGMHAAACVFMAYCRPTVMRLFAPREGYEFGAQPTVASMGMQWFLSYAGVLIFLHHLALFFIEAFTLSGFFTTILKVILSSICTLALVVLVQFLFRKNVERQ